VIKINTLREGKKRKEEKRKGKCRIFAAYCTANEGPVRIPPI
jgi:hypothetical protein